MSSDSIYSIFSSFQIQPFETFNPISLQIDNTKNLLSSAENTSSLDNLFFNPLIKYQVPTSIDMSTSLNEYKQDTETLLTSIQNTNNELDALLYKFTKNYIKLVSLTTFGGVNIGSNIDIMI
jgi:hypothetical protein